MGTTSSKTQMLDQARAAHAWATVQQVLRQKDSDKKDFVTQAKKFPTRIMTSGLGQAVAFLEAKGYAKDMGDRLGDWINQRRPSPQKQKLLHRIIHEDADFLRFATAESLAYLQWLGRFAEAELKTD